MRSTLTQSEPDEGSEVGRGMLSKASAAYGQVVDMFIRPTRSMYRVADLGPRRFRLGETTRVFCREDLSVQNPRGLEVVYSHFGLEQRAGEVAPGPVVVYCHGNSGSRLDALEAVRLLLPMGIGVVALDFAGSGLSDGEYVTLGYYEVEDLYAVLLHVKERGATRIGLWGRSMGAVTCLRATNTKFSRLKIDCIVLDSPYLSLTRVCRELVERLQKRIPKVVVSLGLKVVRKSVKSRAKFDIYQLNNRSDAMIARVPALFSHGSEDDFVHPQHTVDLYRLYGFDKQMMLSPGGHNDPRPRLVLASFALFFNNYLWPSGFPPSVSSPQDTLVSFLGVVGLMSDVDPGRALRRSTSADDGHPPTTATYDASKPSSTGLLRRDPEDGPASQHHRKPSLVERVRENSSKLRSQLPAELSALENRPTKRRFRRRKASSVRRPQHDTVRILRVASDSSTPKILLEPTLGGAESSDSASADSSSASSDSDGEEVRKPAKRGAGSRDDDEPPKEAAREARADLEAGNPLDDDSSAGGDSGGASEPEEDDDEEQAEEDEEVDEDDEDVDGLEVDEDDEHVDEDDDGDEEESEEGGFSTSSSASDLCALERTARLRLDPVEELFPDRKTSYSDSALGQNADALDSVHRMQAAPSPVGLTLAGLESLLDDRSSLQSPKPTRGRNLSVGGVASLVARSARDRVPFMRSSVGGEMISLNVVSDTGSESSGSQDSRSGRKKKKLREAKKLAKAEKKQRALEERRSRSLSKKKDDKKKEEKDDLKRDEKRKDEKEDPLKKDEKKDDLRKEDH